MAFPGRHPAAGNRRRERSCSTRSSGGIERRRSNEYSVKLAAEQSLPLLLVGSSSFRLFCGFDQLFKLVFILLRQVRIEFQQFLPCRHGGVRVAFPSQFDHSKVVEGAHMLWIVAQ